MAEEEEATSDSNKSQEYYDGVVSNSSELSDNEESSTRNKGHTNVKCHTEKSPWTERELHLRNQLNKHKSKIQELEERITCLVKNRQGKINFAQGPDLIKSDRKIFIHVRKFVQDCLWPY